MNNVCFHYLMNFEIAFGNSNGSLLNSARLNLIFKISLPVVEHAELAVNNQNVTN